MSGDSDDEMDDLNGILNGEPDVKMEGLRVPGPDAPNLSTIMVTIPKTVRELQRVIRAAVKLKLQVRVAGAGLSWSNLFTDFSRDLLIRLEDLVRPGCAPRIELNKSKDGETLVTMAANVTVGEFLEFQLENGVTIPSNTTIKEATMGGVVAGGCHGVGWDSQTVSDRVVSMCIVDSEGNLRTYCLDENRHVMKAILCHLGLWGVVVEMTLKVDPIFTVEVDHQYIKIDDLFYSQKKLCEIIRSNWSVEIFWFPFNSIADWKPFEAFKDDKQLDISVWDPKEDEVILRVINKVEQSTSGDTDRKKEGMKGEFQEKETETNTGDLVGEKEYRDVNFEKWLQENGHKYDRDFLKRHSQVAPIFLRDQMKSFKEALGGRYYQKLPHAIHYRDHDNEMKLRAMEWAFSLDDDCSNLCKAIQELVDLIQKEASKRHFPINQPVDIRFMADSEALLAPPIAGNPTYGGSGHTCYIEVMTLFNTPGWTDFGCYVSSILGKLQNARPHWCKEWAFLPDIEVFLRKAHAKQMPSFLGALEQSGVDPSGVFFNQQLEKIFYPRGHPGGKRNQQNGGDKPESSCSCNIL